MLFEEAKPTELLEGLRLGRSAAQRCHVDYLIGFQLSRKVTGVRLPDTLERDGRSRYRILKCSVSHLSYLYAEDRRPSTRRDNVADYTDLCGCSISAIIGNRCGWRKIPVRVMHFPEPERPRQYVMVSNLR